MAFFAALPETLKGLRREPTLMALAMIILAVGCLALSLIVLTGFSDPWLIGPAQQVLTTGVFGG
jgi:hypothetical protein